MGCACVVCGECVREACVGCGCGGGVCRVCGHLSFMGLDCKQPRWLASSSWFGLFHGCHSVCSWLDTRTQREPPNHSTIAQTYHCAKMVTFTGGLAPPVARHARVHCSESLRTVAPRGPCTRKRRWSHTFHKRRVG